ncbi:LamG-like jellyroll fold domain-containing protein [Streptomyces sp. NBC_00122]|uniref:LamG-like jellyroll fold domain-containing protein n=1 Tax=Streptomyces sp. NBC_00122 TaxID=2903623 RepID=UPI00386FC5AA
MRLPFLPSRTPKPVRRLRASGVAMLPVAGAAALSLGAGLIAAPPATADDARSHGPATSTWPAPTPRPPSAESAAIDTAKAQAKSSGKPVVINHLTTGSSQTFATPAGTLTTDTTPVPTRVKTASGTWQAVDATLRANADGTVTPAAVPSRLSLSGGGTGPMATMTTADGKKLALKAPFPLPKPVLNGDSTLYSSVLPGVDLELSANTLGGWRQVLIVRTAEAAANPAVKKLQLSVEADGLTVSADGAGNLKAADGQGKTRFSAPTPLMWDSAGAAAAAPSTPTKSAGALAEQSAPAEDASTPSSTDGPGTGAAVQKIGTSVDAQGIKLVPDAALLGQGTGPWYIDPGWNPTLDNANQAWAQVQEAPEYADVNEFNGTQYGQDRPAAGYCGYNIGNPPCTGIGRTRAYFQIGMDSRLHNSEVINATFYATVVSSSSPSTVTPMGLYSTGYISNPTSWNQQPCDKNSHMGGCSKIGTTDMSGSGDIQFDVKNLVKSAVGGQWPTITLGLAPDDEYNKQYRQRFANTPHIVVEYDITPTVWWPRTSPTPGFADTASYADCRTPGTANPWDNPGWVGANNNIALTTSTYSATGQQLYTGFQYWDDDNGGATQYADASWNSSYGAVSVDIGSLTDGHQYGWVARAADGTLTSNPTEMCFFRVDRTPPTATVTSTDFPASGTIGAHPKRVGEPGTFTLSGTDPGPVSGGRSSGLACARWTTDPVKAAATGWKCTDTGPGMTKLTGGKATITIQPPRWGTNYVYLQTQDNAGNMSQPFVYSYYAPSNPDAGKPVFGDITGDNKPDILLPDTAGDLRKIGGGEDPYGAPRAKMVAAVGNTGNWNGIQISHGGSLARKTVDDLFAHQSGSANLYVYPNDGNGGWFDGQASVPVTKPTNCLKSDKTTITCATYGYGADWAKVTQIAAFGSVAGESGTPLPQTSLLFVENGRLWLATAGTNNQLASQAILLSGNDTKWDGYELIAPGRAQGTAFPTLWARSKADGGTLHAFTVKGATDLTGFNDPAAGLITGKIDPKTYPRVGSNGDISGDKIPDVWAVDTNQQLVSFYGTGTAPGTDVPHPTTTGVDTSPVALADLNRPTAQWTLTSQTGNKTRDEVGVDPATAPAGTNPATTAGITFTQQAIGGRDTTHAAFKGTASTVTSTTKAVDTRNSFTISTWAKTDTTNGGIIASQDGTRSSAFLLYADPNGQAWRFAIARGDTDGLMYDWTDLAVNSAARFTPGEWTRVSAVYDANTGLMRLYVNGTLASTGHHTASTSQAPAGPLVMGRYKKDGQPHYLTESGFVGGVSNLAVYPYAASITAPNASSPIHLAGAAANCVDNDYDRDTDGNKIQISGCNGTTAQQFQIRNDGTIQTHGKCLNAAAAGTANTTLIELHACDPSAKSQQFLPRANGTIYNPASGRCIDLGNYDTTPGHQLWLFDCNASPAQTWTIPALGTAPLPLPVPPLPTP